MTKQFRSPLPSRRRVAGRAFGAALLLLAIAAPPPAAALLDVVPLPYAPEQYKAIDAEVRRRKCKPRGRAQKKKKTETVPRRRRAQRVARDAPDATPKNHNPSPLKQHPHTTNTTNKNRP
jgi:hypothetical protein